MNQANGGLAALMKLGNLATNQAFNRPYTSRSEKGILSDCVCDYLKNIISAYILRCNEAALTNGTQERMTDSRCNW